MTRPTPFVQWLDRTDAHDLARVGGKNASLGEMLRHLGAAGVRVPPGFATTAEAYRRFVDANGFDDALRGHLDALEAGTVSLAEAGRKIRALFTAGTWPDDLDSAIREAYRALCERAGGDTIAVAVRSSATAEDLPQASFAGQLESFLAVRGEDALLDRCRDCLASLFTDRAIAYRREQGFDHLEIALSVGVQQMVGSDRASAGVLFTLDTETGFPDVVRIDAAWGLGECVVQGTVDPDHYVVWKTGLDDPTKVPILDKRRGAKAEKMVVDPDGGTCRVATDAAEQEAWVLTDAEILQLGRWARAIETHYDRPMDIEWAKDADSGELFIVQARPETVQSRRAATALETFILLDTGEAATRGLAIGHAIASGPVCRLDGAHEIDRFRDGSVLVTPITDPDWVPLMRRAAGIVTDHGGRTSHAAIISRELGIPAIVGTGDATRVLADGETVTLSCAEGDEGRVYRGELAFDRRELDLADVPTPRTRVMTNIASPAAAMRWWRLPNRGIGLLRMEYIINNVIKIHPMALAHFTKVPRAEVRHAIARHVGTWDDPEAYFVDHLAWGLATIAASQYPEPVIVRMSDFKTNEYAALLGGTAFEPEEENPMLGWRGASRYDHPGYRDGFALECAAVRRVRETIGLDNVRIMIPFCRTPEEADRVLALLAEHGLRRGEKGLEVWVMCEVPSNVVLAEDFAQRFDGFSIGSNDLTQLVLGVDRDSERLAHLFDERHPAVRRMIAEVIERAHRVGCPVGICGQAPSDHPDFAAFLVEAGIDSISLTPDSLLPTIERIVEVERQMG